MTDSRKKRMAMLDSLSAAAPAPPPSSMMTTNRALRSARDAVDAHQVWDLDPWAIEDTRIADRLDPADVLDLRDAIEANGQTVPILVRRHPSTPERYLLVYGRRRLEAVRQSDKVTSIRALVANLDDHAAMRAQISENMARRDLSFIEKALFARELLDSGFGTQSQIAEVLTVTKSAISMALAVVDSLGVDLIRAIGPAHGIGRPRWEALATAVREAGLAPEPLIRRAEEVHAQADRQVPEDSAAPDPSVVAFDAVRKAAEAAAKPAKPARAASDKSRTLMLDGKRAGSLRYGDSGLRLDIRDAGFAAYLEGELDSVLQELHARYAARRKD